MDLLSYYDKNIFKDQIDILLLFKISDAPKGSC
jgi:hypothetical protein